MKKSIKNIFILVAAVVAIVAIFVSTQIPTINPTINNLPLVIVNEDKSDISNVMVEKIKENSKISDKVSVNWSEVENKDTAIEKMDDGEYYGALIIPESFAKDINTLTTANVQTPNLNIIVNQGQNSQLSTQVTQLLTSVANNSGRAISEQVVQRAQGANQDLPAQIVQNLMNPVKVNVEDVNTTGDFANAQGVFFYSVWMASLISSITLFNFGKREYETIKEKATHKVAQIVLIAGLSLIVGYSAPYFTKAILGVSIDNYFAIGGFLSICAFAFITLISGFVNWGGVGMAPLFGVLLFFGMPLLSMAPEMLGSFYTKWILPWFPMKFLYDGVKNIMFFNQGFWNGATQSLVIISLIGIVLILSSSYNVAKEKVKK